MKKFPPVKHDKESGLPKKYVAGLSTSTAKARAAHWKKRGKLDPSDASAYKPAPGDATSKTKPSKYTTKYHAMYDKAPIEEQTPAEVAKSERAFAKFRKRDRYIQIMNKRMHHLTKHSQFEEETQNSVDEHIVKVGDKYRLVSKKTGRNLGTYDTKAGAMKRERQVQYFKHMGEEEMKEAVKTGNEERGYHGEHPSDTADAAYSRAHAIVKKVAGEAGHLRTAKKPNVMVKHYLDSNRGRLLKGNENNHEYIKKDFGKFAKSYDPQHFNEGKHQATIAAIAAHGYDPKVGDNIRTKMGGQIPGKIEKIDGTKIYFRHPEGKLYATHSRNVRLDEAVSAASSIKSFLGFKKPEENKKSRPSWDTQKKFFANLQKQTQTSTFQQHKPGKIVYVHQVAEMDKSQPAAGRDSDTPFPEPKPIKLTDKQRAQSNLIAKQLIGLAKAKLKKEEIEQVDEISHATLGKYIEKADKSADDLAAQGKYRQSNDRRLNVIRAQTKQIDQRIAGIKKSMGEEAKQVDENYRALATKGIGAERKEDIKVGHGVDYYHPKDGSKHMGKIHSMNDKGYTVKDDKTGEKHSFQYYKNIDEGTKEVASAVKQAKGIAFGKRYKAGNYTGAYNAISKLGKKHGIEDLPSHPEVKSALARANMEEEVEQVNERKEVTHEDPLVTVHDKHGLHTHANLSTANRIFGTKVSHTDVHAGPVKTSSESGKGLTFAISQHHAKEVVKEGAADTSLAKKAEKSGISVGTLRKVFNRGKAAWRTGHRPGTTPDQWGHARVNSYITKGKTYHTADKDLHRESVDVNEAFEKQFGDEIE